jgi:ribosomal protein S18 acetylase RimI-like enzyme
MIIITGGIIATEFGEIYWDFYSDEGPYIELYNLYIKPQYREKGFARILLLSAINIIKHQYPNLDIKIIATPGDSSVDCKRLISFYQSLGLIVHSIPINKKS